MLFVYVNHKTKKMRQLHSVTIPVSYPKPLFHLEN